jgi:hypothetical protein
MIFWVVKGGLWLFTDVSEEYTAFSTEVLKMEAAGSFETLMRCHLFFNTEETKLIAQRRPVKPP